MLYFNGKLQKEIENLIRLLAINVIEIILKNLPTKNLLVKSMKILRTCHLTQVVLENRKEEELPT